MWAKQLKGEKAWKVITTDRAIEMLENAGYYETGTVEMLIKEGKRIMLHTDCSFYSYVPNLPELVARMGEGDNSVICDFCNKDGEENYGGGLVGYNAVCQECLDNVRPGYDKECPDKPAIAWPMEFTFADNCRCYRFFNYGSDEAIIELWSEGR